MQTLLTKTLRGPKKEYSNCPWFSITADSSQIIRGREEQTNVNEIIEILKLYYTNYFLASPKLRSKAMRGIIPGSQRFASSSDHPHGDCPPTGAPHGRTHTPERTLFCLLPLYSEHLDSLPMFYMGTRSMPLHDPIYA